MIFLIKIKLYQPSFLQTQESIFKREDMDPPGFVKTSPDRPHRACPPKLLSEGWEDEEKNEKTIILIIEQGS